MDENLQPQEGMNPESEVIEETDTDTRIAELEAKLAEEQQAKSEILARAKKAEAQLKTAPKPITNTLSKEDIEETILRSEGIDDDTLTEMKALAKVRNTTLLAVKSDPIYLAMKAQKEAEAKALAARLPASKGSGSVKKEKGFGTAGLSEAEHKALWKAQNN